LDGDGLTDILSGSWPGEIYFFRRQRDGKFAAGEILKDKDGKTISVGAGSSVFAVDWNHDGAIDLIIGNVLGEVYLIPNEGKDKKLSFGAPRRLEADGKPIKVNGDAAPVVADWDGDGKNDLIVGAEDGSVVWYRNVGSPKEPKLEAARPLVDKSPIGWGGDERLQPGQWGLRVKPCVVDWNGDSRLDLLLGDRCGGFNAKPAQTKEETAEERKANDRLPELRRKWAAAFQSYEQAGIAAEKEGSVARQQRQLDALREDVRRIKDEIAVVEKIQEQYKPGNQAHGFVWLFQRKPLNKKFEIQNPKSEKAKD
jgi:hypothetical protein